MNLEGSVNGQKVKGQLNKLNSLRGYSAYEVACINGFEGTEEEWLASLKGEKGEPANARLSVNTERGTVAPGKTGTWINLVCTDLDTGEVTTTSAAVYDGDGFTGAKVEILPVGSEPTATISTPSKISRILELGIPESVGVQNGGNVTVNPDRTLTAPDTMIVTGGPNEGIYVSHTAGEIYAHVMNGGYAILLYSGVCYSEIHTLTESLVVFGRVTVTDNGTSKRTVRIDAEGKAIGGLDHHPANEGVAADWSQNDEDAADYVKNRTHYTYYGIKEEGRYFSVDPVNGAIVEDAEFATLLRENYETARYYANGECRLVEGSEDVHGDVLHFKVYRSGVTSSDDSEENIWRISVYSGSHVQFGAGQEDEFTTGAITIQVEGELVEKLDEKYLPGCVVKSVNGVRPDADGNVVIAANGDGYGEIVIMPTPPTLGSSGYVSASVLQSLSEWQKATARKNIGAVATINGVAPDEEGNVQLFSLDAPSLDAPDGEAAVSVQADWNQSDPSKSDYIKNKPFGDRYGDTLTWNGNTDGLYGSKFGLELAGKFYNVTREYFASPNAEELSKAIVLLTFESGGEQECTNLIATARDNGVVVVSTSGGTPVMVSSPGEGLFLYHADNTNSYVKYVNIPGYTGFRTRTKVDTKFLPEPRGYGYEWISEMKEVMGGVVSTVNGVKPDANGNVQISISGGGNANGLTLKSPDGTEWVITVSDSGVVSAQKKTNVGGDTGGGSALETYTIFVPENVSNEYVAGSDGKTLNITTAQFLELFYDGFVSSAPAGVTVTKKSIGKDESGQYDMWEYDFCPTNYNRTILLSSGMHTYELSASFGLANFIGHLYTDTGNDAFDYIRNNVRIKVIPIVNPWGFNQSPKKYGNVNGINPNRNFDIDGQWEAYAGDTNEWNHKGAYPFSESEVHNLARWAEENWNADFWIDCHTGLGYADKDLWVYYSSDSEILDRINGGISAIETWFKNTYGQNCVTTRTIDNPDSIRLHWAEKIAGIPGMTVEQAPGRTTFGTSANNDSGDISNYSTVVSTFVQEFLLEKYRDSNTVAITGVSASDISIPGGSSTTVTATVTPGNTTQNKFKWESSDESVAVVYGCTDKAVIVPKGSGVAQITLTNRYNPSIKTNFEVSCDNVIENVKIGAGRRKINAYVGNVAGTASNRILTDMIPIAGGEISVEVPSAFYVKAFVYDENRVFNVENSFVGKLDSRTIAGSVPGGYIRVLIKKADDSDISEGEMLAICVNVNGVPYYMEQTTETINDTIVANICGINVEDGSIAENTARITTDIIAVAGNSGFDITSDNGYYIKLFFYDADGTFNAKTLGTLTKNTETTKTNTAYWHKGNYFRILVKKPDGSDFTEEEFRNATITIEGSTFSLVQSENQ